MKVLAAIDDDQASMDALAFAQQVLHEDDQVLVLNVVSTADTAGVSFGLAESAVPAVWASVQDVVERQRKAALELARDVAADVESDAKGLVSLGPVGPTIQAMVPHPVGLPAQPEGKSEPLIIWSTGACSRICLDSKLTDSRVNLRRIS